METCCLLRETYQRVGVPQVQAVLTFWYTGVSFSPERRPRPAVWCFPSPFKSRSVHAISVRVCCGPGYRGRTRRRPKSRHGGNRCLRARHLVWDDAYQLQTSPGFGGRLGSLRSSRNFEIEGQSRTCRPTPTTPDTFSSGFDSRSPSSRVGPTCEYNINFRPMALIIGRRVTYSGYGGFYDTIPGSHRPNKPVVPRRSPVRRGWRAAGPHRRHLRLRAQHPAEFTGPPDNAGNWGLQAGLSLMFPKEKPKDTDKDGVIDKLDQCPNTPVGTKVDDKGCPIPLDDDKDGVVNDSDQCPNTPAGETVNSVGCSASPARRRPRWREQCPRQVPEHPGRRPRSTPPVARPTTTRTACRTPPTSARTPRPARRSTPGLLGLPEGLRWRRRAGLQGQVPVDAAW